MKKGLFLLPLVGGLMLSGCTFELFGKQITLFEKEQSSTNNKPSGGTKPSGGGNTPAAPTHSDLNVTVDGSRLAWIDFHTDVTTTKTAETCVFETNDVTVTVAKNGAYQDAGGSGQAYVANPVRTYSGQKITVEYTSTFKTICFDSPHFNDNPYDEWFRDAVNAGSGATAELQGAVVVITLSAEANKFEIVVPSTIGTKNNPQIRFYSIELWK